MIGAPEALVLLDRSNVTRYGFIMRGIRHYIDAHEPGGFRGWLQAISDAKPDVLIVDENYPRRLRELAPDWHDWLAGYRRRPEKAGNWSIYLPAEAG